MPRINPILYSLQKDSTYATEARWVINVLSSYASIDFTFSDSAKDFIFPINHSFFDKVYEERGSTSEMLNAEMNILFEDGTIDYISTAFYFLNCLWEREPTAQLDHWHRSEFTGSIWTKFGHKKPITKVNQVFDLWLIEMGVDMPKQQSTVFLSHDIDVVYGAYLEDGMALLKKGRIAKFIHVIKNHFINGPQWFNFRSIASIEHKHECTSTFFWIPLKGKVEGVGKNADYELKSAKINDELIWLNENGFSNGIHKSIAALSLKEELELMGEDILANRYHYLKFRFDQLKSEMNSTGLLMDASLGYAEVSGYRNGYSLPFIPFDLENRKPCSFIEVPLTIMDGTYSKYKKLDGEDALSEIKEFINEYESNSVISILWHNSHFTNYKYEGYPAVYEEILKKIKEKSLKTVSPKELIDRYLRNAE